MEDPTADPAARALTLLSLLQARSGWTATELAERLQVSARTVRRDLERLRRLGYAVRARPGPGSSYRLAPGMAVPPLLFEPDEVTALINGLQIVIAERTDDDAAVTALAKLHQVLPRRLLPRARAVDLATEVLEADDSADSASVGVVAEAVAEHGRVRFDYRDGRGRSTTRLVEPYRHVSSRRRWYLVAFDVDRDDWRCFRFDRLSRVERVPGTFAGREFPFASIADWLATDFGRLAGGSDAPEPHIG